MKELDLFWTCIKDDANFLNKRKLEYFIKVIRDTEFKRTLKSIHICEDDFPEKDLKVIFAR